MRWICLPSESLGQDWFLRSQEIDSILTESGFDLAEESTYLLFSEAPDKVLEGHGECLIARPVIGPSKVVDPPFLLIDWKAAPVWQENLSGEAFIDLLSSAQEVKVKISKEPRDWANAFNICVQRKLRPELILSVDVIFHE